MVDGKDNGTNDLVEIDTGSVVSFQILQDVYNTVTGKTEKLIKLFKDPYHIHLGDIEQLNLKMVQIGEQYTIRATNSTVTVFHCKGGKEVYSSFERFKIYNSSNPVPIENIMLEYNFLIILPKAEKPQPYKISIDLPSRAGIWEKARNDQDMPAMLFRMMNSFTGRVKIEYVDYHVARNYLGAIDEWFLSLNKASENKLLTTAQKFSHFLRGLFQFGLPFTYLAYFYFEFSIPPEQQITNTILLYLLITVFGGVFVLYGLGNGVGRLIEASIDRIQILAFVQLNKGDEECIKRHGTSNSIYVVKTVGWILFTIALGLTTTYLGFVLGLESLASK